MFVRIFSCILDYQNPSQEFDVNRSRTRCVVLYNMILLNSDTGLAYAIMLREYRFTVVINIVFICEHKKNLNN